MSTVGDFVSITWMDPSDRDPIDPDGIRTKSTRVYCKAVCACISLAEWMM